MQSRRSAAFSRPYGGRAGTMRLMLDFLSANQWLAGRIAAGALVFLILAGTDIRRHGRRASRWREYLFLIFVTCVAMLYGAVNDQVTSRISWEYFYYGKELSKDLGLTLPPDGLAMSWAAAKVGMGATWSAGLLIGAVLLIANNPRARRRRLSYTTLATALPWLLLVVIPCSVVGGLLGYAGALTWTSADFGEMVTMDYFRPFRFMAAWGAHLGAYAGGLIGLVVVTLRVLSLRRVSTRET